MYNLMYKDFLVRKEDWGAVLQDTVHDRIWAMAETDFLQFAQSPEKFADTLYNAHPYRHKGWFFIRGELPKQFSLSAPVSVSWNLTDSCNSHCLFCCNNAVKERAREVDTERAYNIVDTLSEWGIMRLIIGGGEPTLCNNLPQLLRYCRKKGVFPALATNGILLTPPLLKVAMQTCCTIQISLDTLSPNIYMYLRGNSALPAVLRNIEYAAAAHAPLRIVTVVTEKNFSELDDLAKYLDKNSIRQWFVFSMLKSGRALANEKNLGTVESAKLIAKLRTLSAQYPKIDLFTWGDRDLDQISVYVESNGHLVIRSYSAGTIMDLSQEGPDSLRRLWDTFDGEIKSNTLLNFIQPNRVVAENRMDR